MAKKLHLIHVKSHVAGKAPSASTLNYGEIAVNYNSETPAIYIRDDDDNVVKFVSEPYFNKIVGTGVTENDGETITPLSEIIVQDEITVSSALNDLNNRKADKSYVDEELAVALNSQPITYTDIVAKRNNDELVAGQWYRITDYVATTTDAESRSLNHPFDIIVLAITDGELSEEGFAALHDSDTYFANTDFKAWKVWYCLDNDTSRFTWADTVNGRGVVYRLIDEWNNDLPYDFKGIQFKRYKITPKADYATDLADISGLYIGMNGASSIPGIDVDTTDFKWFYTFSKITTDYENPIDGSIDGTCFNNSFEAVSYDSATLLSNLCFIGGTVVANWFKALYSGTSVDTEGRCENTHASKGVQKITVFGECCNNYILSQWRRNVIISSFRHNEFGTDFQDNLLYSPYEFVFNSQTAGVFWNNIMKSGNTNSIARNVFKDFRDNILISEDSIIYNNFGVYFQNNKIIASGYIQQNTFGPSTYNNVITTTRYISQNTFITAFRGNTITCSRLYGNFCYSGFYTNIVNTASDFMGNSFLGIQCNNNTFGGLVNCVIFDICSNLIFQDKSAKYIANCDFKSLRGTSSVKITLDYDEFYLSSITSTTRRVTIEGDTTGSVVATWKGATPGQTVGVYKAAGANVWTPFDNSIEEATNAEVDALFE